MVVVFKAREATIKIEDDVTIGTDGNLAADFAASAETQVKNITVTPPEGAVEKIDCLGETSDFQNQYLDIKSFGMAMCSGTLIMDGDEQNPILEAMGGTGTSVTGSYTRHQAGSSASGSTRTGTSAILVSLTDGAEIRNIVLDNAYFNIKDQKLTGADGHWEFDFEAVCLCKDYYDEFND